MMTASPRAPSPIQAPDIVLYHADCADGFGSAWSIWKKFPAAQFIPVKHGFPPPPDLANRHVVIVDFSYARPLLDTMAKEAASLLILDHHITAQQALENFPHAYFDLKKSGAVLAWEWAHQTPAPWLPQYIQDKDLWHWALPDSREITAALSSYPFDFALWDSFNREALIAEGKAILRYEQEMIGKILAEAVTVTFHGHKIPTVQSTILTSQIGERLAKGHPFCLIWHDKDGRRYFSMRSAPDGADVAAIAIQHGGGGHTHAAGFSVPLSEAVPDPLAPLFHTQAKK
ncbi:MAG: phosphoesterase [Nitrospiraceae bacterium]